ncbi:MAG: hypothetical protein LBB58_00850 [Cellulomonadaceae bacterium]|jgi:hypothetical protein|nr:hypothetical protein [Cellulomonadaceae bacterium]
MPAIQTAREKGAELSTPESDTTGTLSTSALPAAQTYVLAEVVSKIAEAAVSASHAPTNPDQVADATYLPPGLEVLSFPELLNTYDGFEVSGRAWGTAIAGRQVQVSIAGVTRSARVIDGLWDVVFEDGALPRYGHGTREIRASIRDSHGSTSRTSLKVMLEEFAEGYVQIDAEHEVRTTARGSYLVVKGDLALGTHDQARELVVLLVHDDEAQSIAATGAIKAGWQFGEWRAWIPLRNVKPGTYNVRAQLMDHANAALTHIALGNVPVTI